MASSSSLTLVSLLAVERCTTTAHSDDSGSYNSEAINEGQALPGLFLHWHGLLRFQSCSIAAIDRQKPKTTVPEKTSRSEDGSGIEEVEVG